MPSQQRNSPTTHSARRAGAASGWGFFAICTTWCARALNCQVQGEDATLVRGQGWQRGPFKLLHALSDRFCSVAEAIRSTDAGLIDRIRRPG